MANRITYGYYFSFISLGLMMAALGPTLPDLAEQTDSQLKEIGILFTVRSLGALLGTLIVGYLYDRYPGHPIMAGMLILMGLMLALTPVVPVLWVMVGLFLLLGISESGINVGGNTLIVWVHGTKVGPFMNALHFFFGVGSFICPIIIAQVVLASGDIAPAYWILAVLMLPAAFWLYRLPSPVDGSRTQENTAPLNIPLVVMIGLFFFFLAGGNYTFGGWIYTYALELDLASKTEAAYINAAYLGAVTLARLLAIPIASYIRPRIMIMANLIGMFLSACFLIVFKSSLALWIGVISTGLFAATVFPTMLAYAGTKLNMSAFVTSIFIIGVNVGGMFMPGLVGFFFDAGQPELMMWYVAVNLLVVIAIFWLMGVYAERPVIKIRADESAPKSRYPTPPTTSA